VPAPLDQSGPFDVVVIGGGIIGCGIARDAALRGLSVALLEQRDFGSGTTAGSTRLIHGGLRYLATYDFALVRLDLREREILLRIAPHLVKPIQFVLPLPTRLFTRWKLRIGMWLYDLLSYDKSLPKHRVVGIDELARLEPGLDRRHLSGAALFWDAQCAFPERLAIENVIDAHAHGAVVRNYTEVVGAIYEGERIVGVTVRDAAAGAQSEVRGRVVVNASGPWFDRVAGVLDPDAPRRVRMTKGIHIACEPFTQHAIVLESAVDGRTVFAIPWAGHTWLGTTDTDFDGDPATAAATDDDVRYLVDSIAPHLPALRTAKQHWTTAGVRALVLAEGSASKVSRMHALRTDVPGLVSIIGGKLTGYRAIAEEVVDHVARTLGRSAPCVTASRPLGQADGAAGAAAPSGIVDAVRRAIRQEWSRTLADFVLRRSRLGAEGPHTAADAQAATQAMQRELGWSDARTAAEVTAIRARFAASDTDDFERAPQR
jgi:glycerol-3-phosphate dehydrogenase